MPATLLAQRISDVVEFEADNLYSREALASAVFSYTGGGAQENGCGMVVGRKTVGAVAAAARAGNTGNGALGTWTAGNGCRVGVYTAVCIEPATNLGVFALYGPDGKFINKIVVGTAYSGGGVSGTIADGATDWVSGDAIDITVSAAAQADVVPWAPTATDGSDEVYGVQLVAPTASSLKAVVLRRMAILNVQNLVWGAGVTLQSQKDTALAALHALGLLTSRVTA